MSLRDIFLPRAVPFDDRPVVNLPAKQVPATYDYSGWAEIMNWPQPTVNQVTHETVGGLPALDFAVNLVAYSVTQMIVAGTIFDADGTETDKPSILERPFKLYRQTEFWHSLIRTLMIDGNWYGVLHGLDPVTECFTQVIPVNPDNITLQTNAEGMPYYRIGDRIYPFEAVLHVRKDLIPGSFLGQGAIGKFRGTFETAIAQQTYGRTSFTNAGVPTGIVSLDTDEVSSEELTAVKEQWLEKQRDGRAPMVLPGLSIKYTPISWKPQDMEYVQAMGLGIAQFAYMVGLVPSDLEAVIASGGNSMTYANLTDRQYARIVSSFKAIADLVVEAWSDLLPTGITFEADRNALLPPMAELEYLKLAKEIGAYTDAEIRQALKRPPLEEAS